MRKPSFFTHRRVRAGAVAVLAGGTLALSVPGSAAPAAPAAGALAGIGSTTCPAVYPIDKVHAGMVGTGYATDHGLSPAPFSATVLGVAHDALGPGWDLIMIKATSPAISRVGGVWYGMSGSPVYAADGRLLGAIAWGLSGGATKVIGLTPAAKMYDLLSIGASARPLQAQGVALTPALQRVAVAAGAAPAEAARGMRPMPIPVSVSGMAPRRLAQVEADVEARQPGAFTFYQGSPASSRKGDVAKVVPGAPIAAAVSYGDMTFAAIGTVTAVCGTRILAFGHDFQALGTTTESAHLARVLFIHPDPLFGPFTMANPGRLVGTFRQDRLTGISAKLGTTPPSAVVRSTTTADTGLRQSGRSYAVIPQWVPDVAANAAYNGVQLTLLKGGEGRAWFRWSAHGTRANGDAWHFSRTDRTTSEWGIEYSVGDSLYYPLADIVNNPYEKINVDAVTLKVQVASGIRELRLVKLLVQQGSSWVEATPDLVVQANPGDTLALRAKLAPYRGLGHGQAVDLGVTVPADAVPGMGQVTVFGGANASWVPYGGESPADGKTFLDALKKLRNIPRNDAVYAKLQLSNDMGNLQRVDRVKELVPQVVRGTIGLQVEVPGSEPPVPPEPLITF